MQTQYIEFDWHLIKPANQKAENMGLCRNIFMPIRGQIKLNLWYTWYGTRDEAAIERLSAEGEQNSIYRLIRDNDD